LIRNELNLTFGVTKIKLRRKVSSKLIENCDRRRVVERQTDVTDTGGFILVPCYAIAVGQITSDVCSIRYVGERYAKHGTGSGPTWWADVDCTGRETDFTQCGQTGHWRRTRSGNVNCVHDDDIAISCSTYTSSRNAGGEVRCRSSVVF